MAEFSALDILDEDVEAFRQIGRPCVILESSLGGQVVIVPKKEMAAQYPSAACYLPEEARYLLSLGDHEAQMLHSLKSKMGGFVEEKKIADGQVGAPVR